MNKDQTSPPFKGSCLCGAVQYCVDQIESQMAHCHCTMCRKFHGAAFATFGAALTQNFHWISGKDQLKQYTGSNGSQRLFCNHCGSSLIFVPANDRGEVVEFSLGTLDSAIPNRPDAHIFTKYGAYWNQISDGLPQYEEGRGSQPVPDAAMQSYYAARAPEYDRVYAKPERQPDLRAIEAALPLSQSQMYTAASEPYISLGVKRGLNLSAHIPTSILPFISSEAFMKIQLREVTQGQWAIYIVSSVGVSAGRTTYASSDEAKKVARTRHPDKEIEIIGK